MRIYILTYHHNDEGCCVSYHSSLKDCRRAFTEAKKQAKEDGCAVEESDIFKHNIPNTKKGFLNFLNNFTPGRDNG